MLLGNNQKIDFNEIIHENDSFDLKDDQVKIALLYHDPPFCNMHICVCG